MSADDRTPTTTMLVERVELPDRPVDLTRPTGAQRLERAQWRMARRTLVVFALANVVVLGVMISPWFAIAYVAVAVGGWYWAWAPIRALGRERS